MWIGEKGPSKSSDENIPRDYLTKHSSKSPHQKRIESFMRKLERELPDKPTQPSKEMRILRARLIMEEALETIAALGVFVANDSDSGYSFIENENLDYHITDISHFDMVEVADGCADLSVVSIGTLSALGISDSPILEMVDQNNLEKFSPGYYIDEGGKLIKPPNHSPPKIKEELERQGWKA